MFGGRNFCRLLSGIHTTIFRPQIFGSRALIFFFFRFSFSVNVAYFRLILVEPLPRKFPLGPDDGYLLNKWGRRFVKRSAAGSTE